MNRKQWAQQAFKREVQDIGLEERKVRLIDSAMIVGDANCALLILSYEYENMPFPTDAPLMTTTRFAVYKEGKDHAQVSGIISTTHAKLDKSAEKQ